MDTALLLMSGGFLVLAGWILAVLFQAIIFGGLTWSCGAGGFYIGSCVPSGTLFEIAGLEFSITGLVAIFLIGAAAHFAVRFFEELRVAHGRFSDPFNRKKASA